jgi:hypothetical protein
MREVSAGWREYEELHNIYCLTFIKYFYSYKIYRDEMDGACNKCGRIKKCVQNFSWET